MTHKNSECYDEKNNRFKPSETLLKLEYYIAKKYEREKSTGQCWITYDEIKEEFEIELDKPKGRGFFYRACKRLGLQHLCTTKYGYHLSSPGIAFQIVGKKVRRIEGAAKNTETAVDNILDTHDEELADPQKHSLGVLKLGCAAIRGQERNLKIIIRKEIPQLSPVKPMV